METWRSIPGYPMYEASTHGRIRSIARIDRKGSRRSERILRPTISQKGYRKVTLYIGPQWSDARYHRVNRLVLLAFTGRAPSVLHHAAHSDGDKGNNRLDNLCWKTPMENVLDRIRHGGYLRRSAT
jgi:hypothetical protein